MCRRQIVNASRPGGELYCTSETPRGYFKSHQGLPEVQGADKSNILSFPQPPPELLLESTAIPYAHQSLRSTLYINTYMCTLTYLQYRQIFFDKAINIALSKKICQWFSNTFMSRTTKIICNWPPTPFEHMLFQGPPEAWICVKSVHSERIYIQRFVPHFSKM